MENKKSMTTIVLTNELREKIDNLSNEIERPMSWIIRKAIIQYIKEDDTNAKNI